MSHSYKFGQWQYVPSDSQLINSHGERVTIEPRLGRLIEIFCTHPGEKLSRDFLLREVWAPRVVSEESLTVAISQLRKQLDPENSAAYIRTIPGHGYLWKPTTEKVDVSKQKTRYSTSLVAGMALAVIAVAVTLMLLLIPDGPVEHHASANTVFEEKLRRANELVANGGDNDEAIRLYRSVLKDAPNADAYLGLTRAKLARISRHDIPAHSEELIQLMKRALEENPDVNEGEWLLGMLYFYGDWNFPEAKRLLLNEYNRGNRTPRFLLEFSEVMLALGESELVGSAIRSLRENHPEFYSAPMLAWLHLMQDQHQKAAREIERILAAEPDSYNLHVSAQNTAYLNGDYGKAWYHLKALIDDADIPQQQKNRLEAVYQEQGLVGVHAELMKKPLSERLGHYRSPVSNARHAIVAGYYDDAIRFLSEAIKNREWEVLWLLADPHYDPLQAHPGYTALVAEFKRLTKAH